MALFHEGNMALKLKQLRLAVRLRRFISQAKPLDGNNKAVTAASPAPRQICAMRAVT